MTVRYPDDVERLLAAGAIPSQYDFDQICAESVVRIGEPLVEKHLTAAARDFGWPIPPSQRLRVACELAALVRLHELPRA